MGRGGVPRGRRGGPHREIHTASELERGRDPAGTTRTGKISGAFGGGGLVAGDARRRSGSQLVGHRIRWSERFRASGWIGERRDLAGVYRFGVDVGGFGQRVSADARSERSGRKGRSSGDSVDGST